MPKPPAEVRYMVQGRIAFPIDMLRYDRVTPMTENDSAGIDKTFFPRNRDNVVVEVVGRRCTQARWESFGWKVIEGPGPYGS